MILQKLYELAKHVKPVGNARVMAAVVQKGRIVCVASNEKKSDPSQKRANKGLCKCGHIKYEHAGPGCLAVVQETKGYCLCTMFAAIEEERIYWHAETKVIKRAKKLIKDSNGYLNGCVLYVARAKKKVIEKNVNKYEFFRRIVWTPGLARPCEGCWKAIAESGITKAEWTKDECF
jgi:tRNA(Arg) A34 adenosine deaminase TadA